MRQTAFHSADEVRQRIQSNEHWMDTNPHDGGNQFYAGERSGLLDVVEYIDTLEAELTTLREKVKQADALAAALEQYSNPNNWASADDDVPERKDWFQIGEDGFDLARAALADWHKAKG